MLDETLFTSELLNAEDSRTFLRLQALTPFFKDSYLLPLLTVRHIPCTEGTWTMDALRQLRESFPVDIFENGVMSMQARHQLSIEAGCDQELVADVLTVLATSGIDKMNLEKQWTYLHLYVNAFPKGFTVQKASYDFFYTVVVEYLSSVDVNEQWLKTRNKYLLETLYYDVTLQVLYDDVVVAWTEKFISCLGTFIRKSISSYPTEQQESLIFHYGILLIFQGRSWVCAETESLSDSYKDFLRLITALVMGKYDNGYKIFLPYIQDYTKSCNYRFQFYPDLLGVAFYFCRLMAGIGSGSFISDCESIIYNIKNNDEIEGYRILRDLAHRKEEPTHEINRYHYRAIDLTNHSILSRILFFFLCIGDKYIDCVKRCVEMRDRYMPHYPVLGKILNDVLKETEFAVEEPKTSTFEVGNLFEKCKPMPRWEIQLTSLAKLMEPAPPTVETFGKQKRLVWYLNFDYRTATPFVQTLTVKGKWSPQGQRLPPRRLADSDVFFLTEQDRLASEAFRAGYGMSDMCFDPPLLFERLCDHPLLFNEADNTPVRLVHKPVEVHLQEEEKGRCQVDISVVVTDKDSHIADEYKLSKLEPGVWGFSRISRNVSAVSRIIGEDGMNLPMEQVPKFLDMMRDLPDLTINADVPLQDADTTPVVQLWQRGNTYLASVRIRPVRGCLGIRNSFIPGQGQGQLIQVQEGKLVHVSRNYNAEIENVKKLCEECPILLENLDATFDWGSTDLIEFFELITELKESKIPCFTEWPAGEKFKLVANVTRKQVSITTQKAGQWFSVSGEIHVNEQEVLALSALLEKSAGNKNRFVQLENGEFLALSQDVYKTLEKIRLLSSRRKGERMVHPLAGALLDELCEDMERVADVNWKEMMSNMRAAFALEPKVPAKLKADLRPYQLEGFKWLCRLSAWGVGGCLADDMGLGKTVQSIAVLLREAKQGPCLIIAPTSVCPNWEDEIHRFAPSLTVERLREAENREQVVDDMDAEMVLIVGYGLLSRVQSILEKREWRMVIFDEAQALKNSETKRSKAASAIPAHFHLALTGTPIENRLDDLWSVFDIINPGLLGTLNDFHKRFMGADQGGVAAQALKMLIRPFILRRLKSQVLNELPELTEQTILIEPTEKEAAFYDALRRNALARIASGPTIRGQKRFCILTELTKLRRACCHASLVDAEVGSVVEPVSSKMQRFLELFEEARSNGHRLLVFSQFTTHLALLRKELDERKIFYQYLDGQTPENARRERVEAFQRGEGDLFLISLKAGGQGLNLTGADYVVHMDPWWNPAVEDQATDRAHRIGQKKPVTVYRLVMAHTVEEHILKLHAQKRDLAADFLEGNEEAVTQATISEEELMALLQ